MAEFTDAFARVIDAEGGYTLTNDPADHGGMTAPPDGEQFCGGRVFMRVAFG